MHPFCKPTEEFFRSPIKPRFVGREPGGGDRLEKNRVGLQGQARDHQSAAL
jgi:hypothetical protein